MSAAGVDEAELRRRLATGLLRDGEANGVVHGAELLGTFEHAPAPAAVLVAFVTGSRPGVLLTKRNEKLRRHAGQVSFPGGRIEPEDADAASAALREAREEIALDPVRVEVLGSLGDFLTGTGFRITPIVALIPPGLALVAEPAEVEAVFELPLDVLLDPRAPRRERQERNGVTRDVWVWPHPEHYIWGATAAILVHVAEMLRQGR
ncbi:MAG TPA: CoA pyrophosphatase [Acetobacteraceae bacterium]